MDGWDLTLLLVTGYVAVATLVRLMVRRRDRLLGEFGRQMAKEKNRKEAKRKKQQSGRGQAA